MGRHTGRRCKMVSFCRHFACQPRDKRLTDVYIQRPVFERKRYGNRRHVSRERFDEADARTPADFRDSPEGELLSLSSKRTGCNVCDSMARSLTGLKSLSPLMTLLAFSEDTSLKCLSPLYPIIFTVKCVSSMRLRSCLMI